MTATHLLFFWFPPGNEPAHSGLCAFPLAISNKHD